MQRKDHAKARHTMLRAGFRLLAAAILAAYAGAVWSTAALPSCDTAKIHCTDGSFNLHNGGLPTSEGPEWGGRATVAKSVFPRVGDSGGAALYVESGLGNALGPSGANTLYLLYDYFEPALSASFFDVFFQVGDEDYLVRIGLGGITDMLAKPAGVPSAVLPDGSFDIGAPWAPLLPVELELARFVGAMTVGISPNSATPHPIAEFELSIDTTGLPEGHGNGIYDPAPAFWSASAGRLDSDPPISSGIFTLNPDGSTIVVPVLGSDGGPVQQGNVPEPGSVLLIGLALAGLARHFRRRH